MLLIERYVYQGIHLIARTKLLPTGICAFALHLSLLDDHGSSAEKTFKPILKAKSSLSQKLNAVAGKPYAKKNVLDVLSAIVKSGCSYVPYASLTALVGLVQVQSMIEQNIDNYRPK